MIMRYINSISTLTLTSFKDQDKDKKLHFEIKSKEITHSRTMRHHNEATARKRSTNADDAGVQNVPENSWPSYDFHTDILLAVLYK